MRKTASVFVSILALGLLASCTHPVGDTDRGSAPSNPPAVAPSPPAARQPAAAPPTRTPTPTPTPALNADGSIDFSDAALKKAIKAKLKIKKNKIFPKDVGSVTELDLSGKKIKSLEGMQHFKKLKTLTLSNNHVSRLEPLQDLTTLKNLTMDSNVVADTTPLSGLKNLTDLSLADNALTDISPVGGLKNLTLLDVGYNFIDNINPVAGLTKLTYLEAAGNLITDISPVAELPSLRDVPSLYNNPVMDYSPLSTISNTVYANLVNEGIYDQKDLDKDKSTWAKIYKEYRAATKKIGTVYKRIIRDDMSDLQKEYAIINYVMKQITYVDDWDRNNPSGLAETYILGHPSIYDAFVLGKGICDSYALSFLYLAREAGLEAYYVLSPPDKNDENHAWNIVKIDGVYYQLDLTWADGDTDSYDYEYMNVSNKTMESLHGDDYPLANASKYPPTTTDMPEKVQSRYYLKHK